jgi:hypothetical protein
MRISDCLGCLPMANGLLACSSSSSEGADTGADVDPGKPPSEFGPKCYAELVDEASTTKLAFEDCTVSAANMEHVSHVFFVFRRLPEGARRMYVSLVLGTVPLTAGVHENARAGAVEATLEDGRTFSVGDVRKEGALALVIDEANTADSGDHLYVSGSLDATLRNLRDDSARVSFRAWINKRSPPPR